MQNNKIKILVVDDEPEYTTLLKLNLERREEYEVLCENDSRQALERAVEFSPDIILLDVVMPGPDGGDVAGELQRHPRLKYVPIIFVTALINSQESRTHVVTTRSGEKMLAKPFRLKTLCDAIDECVALSRAPRPVVAQVMDQETIVARASSNGTWPLKFVPVAGQRQGAQK